MDCVGALQYADLAKKNNEKHMAAVESDNGGFTPRGFGIVGTPEQRAKVMPWKPLLAPYGLLEIGAGGGGADIGPLAQSGTVLVWLQTRFAALFRLPPHGRRQF